MLLFPFCFRLSSVCYLHGTGRFCINGEPPRFLTSSHFVCTVCIFSKAFEADHKSMGLPVKETGLVYLLATRHPCNCRVVLSCTCITEAPNKTHCGRLVRNRRAPSGFCVLFIQSPRCWARASFHVCHTHRADYKTSQPHKVLITYLPLLGGIYSDSCHILQLLLQLSWGVMFLFVHLSTGCHQELELGDIFI